MGSLSRVRTRYHVSPGRLSSELVLFRAFHFHPGIKNKQHGCHEEKPGEPDQRFDIDQIFERDAGNGQLCVCGRAPEEGKQRGIKNAHETVSEVEGESLEAEDSGPLFRGRDSVQVMAQEKSQEIHHTPNQGYGKEAEKRPDECHACKAEKRQACHDGHIENRRVPL